MAIRRLNYTGRRRIRQEDFRIEVREQDSAAPRFDLTVDLDQYDLPPNASVFVEAYRQTIRMRFPFGVVERLRVPNDRRLADFGSTDGVLFRIKVISQEEPRGLLLAEADRIRPIRHDEEEGERFPLLPVSPSEDLGDQVYHLDCTDRPILLVNGRLGDWRAVARDPAFFSLCYPAVLREILVRILRVDKWFSTEDGADWRCQWLLFTQLLPGAERVPSETSDTGRIEDWIDQIIGCFCRRISGRERFDQYWSGVSQ